MTEMMVAAKLQQMENELRHLRQELERLGGEPNNQFECTDTDPYLTEVYN